MKLEVGMYVRNKSFGIGKINKDYFDSNNKHWFNVQFGCYEDEECHCGICEETKGFKVSYNILDLIEPQDLLYVDIDNGYMGGIIVPRIAETLRELEKFKELIKSEAWILKSIVTHEQMEVMQYVIK